MTHATHPGTMDLNFPRFKDIQNQHSDLSSDNDEHEPQFKFGGTKMYPPLRFNNSRNGRNTYPTSDSETEQSDAHGHSYTTYYYLAALLANGLQGKPTYHATQRSQTTETATWVKATDKALKYQRSDCPEPPPSERSPSNRYGRLDNNAIEHGMTNDMTHLDSK